ncbi:AsmA family protein [Thermithiobacillus plumbiphilus]|uniref:AsmA family protein n=1 Tax=Thermithiobacillus plumbiphilus TaxID=1729899 RepID=A0ABU9D8W1_9PROT
MKLLSGRTIAAGLRWTAILLALLLTLLLALMLYLRETDYLRGLIVRGLSEQAGRPVRVEGVVDLQLLPIPSVQLNQIHVPADAGFGGDLLAVERLRVGLEPWPWLRQRKLRLRDFEIDGARLMLQRNAQGVGNWQVLMQRLLQPKPGPSLFQSLDTLRLRHGRLSWQDQNRRQLLLTDLGGQMDNIQRQQAFPLHLGGRWQFGEQAGRLDFATRIQPGPASWLAGLADSGLDLTLAAKKPVMLQLRAPVLSRQGANGQHWQARGLTARLHVQGRQLAGKSDLVLQTSPLSLALNALQVDAGEGARASGWVRYQGADASLRGEVQMPPFDLRRLAGAWGFPLPSTRDPQVYAQAALRLAFTQTNDDWLLRVADGRLDQSSFSGWLRLHAAPFQAQFFAQMDHLSLDRYLPAGSGKASTTTAANAAPLPDWPVSGELRLARFESGKLSGRNLLLELGMNGEGWHVR